MQVFIHVRQQRVLIPGEADQPVNVLLGPQTADLVFASLPESYQEGEQVHGPFTATDHRGDVWHVESAILTERRGNGIWAGVAVGPFTRIGQADQPIIVNGGA